MRIPILRGLASLAAALLGFTAVSCGGGGGTPTMVLVSFSQPNIAGVALNAPLIFTFSDDVDAFTITPDTVQVVGSPSFTFETIVVDGNLVALLPFIPNFEDYSDSGMAPATTYSVFLPVFPSVDTVRSATGKALVSAEPYSFKTLPTPTFVEPRRPLLHAPGPFAIPPGKGDEDGCIQNGTNSLYTYPGFQFATDPDARLLCLMNEGQPRIILDQCSPTHDQRAVGTPSATSPGTLDLGAIRVRFNEPLDPVTVVPWIPTTQLSLNVQLWRVGDSNANPLNPPVQVRTNKPIVNQSIALGTEIILAPVGPQAQGTYLVNIQGVRDLPGNPIVTSDTPGLGGAAPTGYASIAPGLVGKVPPGYRMFFRTLQIPPQNGAFTEEFGNSFFERTAPLFTNSLPGDPGDPVNPIPGAPPFTLLSSEPGQATTANWNGSYLFLGLSGVNTSIDDGSGRLKAVFRPYLGNATDGAPVVSGTTTLDTDVGDGIFEFDSLTVNAGGTLAIIGSRSALVLVRTFCAINGTVRSNGTNGRFGLDSDGTTNYTNGGAIEIGGPGGTGGAGGGFGGHGSPKVVLPFGGDAAPGGQAASLFSTTLGQGGAAAASGDLANTGGSGGGFGTAGTGAGAGPAFGSADFARLLSQFVPDRRYQPNADVSGGTGGGGGGGEDDDGAIETGDGGIGQAGGDDGGGGGGGGGGGIWIIARTMTVGGTGRVEANGGNGGNTYSQADQVFADPDGIVGNGDEFVTGVTPVALAGPGTGEGGGGGGGAGGGILLQARVSMTLDAGATISATGGAGGTTGGGADGGAGGAGRIAIMAFQGNAEFAAGAFTDSGASISPTAGVSGAIWMPTVETVSQGVSTWLDLSTPTALFQPVFYDTNFADLTGVGLTNSVGGDFSALVEFQGAQSLTPDSSNPTSAGSLTGWISEAAFNAGGLNNTRYIRWRWRFRIDADNGDGGAGFDPTVHPMPAILDFTVPFKK